MNICTSSGKAPCLCHGFYRGIIAKDPTTWLGSYKQPSKEQANGMVDVPWCSIEVILRPLGEPLRCQVFSFDCQGLEGFWVICKTSGPCIHPWCHKSKIQAGVDGETREVPSSGSVQVTSDCLKMPNMVPAVPLERHVSECLYLSQEQDYASLCPTSLSQRETRVSCP